MKAFTLTLSFFFILTGVYAQKIEFSVQANSGFFRYAGKSATAESYIHQGQPKISNYTNNPYGNKSGFGYGAGLQGQFVSKGGFIAGLQAGYEALKSKVDINGILLYNTSYDYLPGANFVQAPPVDARGETYLKNKFLNVSPYIGYRIGLKNIKLDLMPGIDLGFTLTTYENGKATTTDGNNTTVQTGLKHDKAPTDVRIKFGAALIYNRVGLNASYAHGLTNYQGNIIGDANFEAHSELMRFGVSYRLN
ncbi:hypothetical protein [Mucilaginibacter flavidus]|uniref:hypothetical protein n=1 Tax=Mucilaginibacter flavidus TaxID=2949309 RepID=UPI0020940048|nr:hypothetical protein [Mucilaginibacter flavidus]MCO5950124.1 hypothetical protein [Mucilaginibacter flavidus]